MSATSSPPALLQHLLRNPIANLTKYWEGEFNLKNQMKMTKMHIATIAVALMITAAFPHSTLAASRPPAFLEIGEVYSTLISSEGIKFKVLEMGNDSWIKVQLVEVGEDTDGKMEKGDVLWMNTATLPYIKRVVVTTKNGSFYPMK